MLPVLVWDTPRILLSQDVVVHLFLIYFYFLICCACYVELKEIVCRGKGNGYLSSVKTRFLVLSPWNKNQNKPKRNPGESSSKDRWWPTSAVALSANSTAPLDLAPKCEEARSWHGWEALQAQINKTILKRIGLHRHDFRWTYIIAFLRGIVSEAGRCYVKGITTNQIGKPRQKKEKEGTIAQ